MSQEQQDGGRPVVADLETFAHDALTDSVWKFHPRVLEALLGVGAGVDCSAIRDGLEASQIVERHLAERLGPLPHSLSSPLGMALVMKWNSLAQARGGAS